MLSVLSAIMNQEFEQIPYIYEDFVVVNKTNSRDKYIKIIKKHLSASHTMLANVISKEFKIGSDFIMAARGIPSPAATLLKIIDKKPLVKYNCIPTISLIPFFLGKEEKVIPVYNDILKSLISSKKISSATKIVPIENKHKIVVFPESGRRITVSSSLQNIYNLITSATKLNGDQIVSMLNNNEIYILNTVALNKMDLLYYPTERIEYDKESIYELIFPKILMLLSGGTESPDVNIFIKTAFSMRHTVDDRITIIETPFTFDEIKKIYGLPSDIVIAV